MCIYDFMYINFLCAHANKWLKIIIITIIFNLASAKRDTRWPFQNLDGGWIYNPHFFFFFLEVDGFRFILKNDGNQVY